MHGRSKGFCGWRFRERRGNSIRQSGSLCGEAVATTMAKSQIPPGWRTNEKPHAQHGFLKILNTGDGRALMLHKSLAIHSRWCWTLKTSIDQRFLQRFQN